jgi:exopolysaccharide production protein ExoQ
MPPVLALLLWLVFLVALLCFDPARLPETSSVLWVPLIWMFITASRLPSQWLGGNSGPAAARLEEGNALDRTIFFMLIILAVGILVSRSFQWNAFFSRNVALTAFLFFALVSVLWSDFPLVAFKRWFRDLGQYLIVLVVLSDPHPAEAVRFLIRRFCYLMIPLSILLIKYYPQFSRQYDSWSGAVSISGATTSKNMLGVACLVSGLFFFWDTVTRWSKRKEPRTKKILAENFAFMAMTLWVLNLCESATSRVCLVLSCLIVAAVRSKVVRRRPGVFKYLIPVCFVLYVILAYGFDLNAWMAGMLGRDPTLTNRTVIWNLLLGMKTNPIIGTGYESFWLGPRLQYIWQRFAVGLNEAHNGYLQVYLNLGLIGLGLLLIFLISSYRRLWKKFTPSSGLSDLASLSLATWTVLLFYNMSEAGLGSGLLWLTLLFGVTAVRERAPGHVQDVAAVGKLRPANGMSRLPLEMASRRQ